MSKLATVYSVGKSILGKENSYRITDVFTQSRNGPEHTVTVTLRTRMNGFQVAVSFDGMERYARDHAWTAIPFRKTINFNGHAYELHVSGYEFGIQSI